MSLLALNEGLRQRRREAIAPASESDIGETDSRREALFAATTGGEHARRDRLAPRILSTLAKYLWTAITRARFARREPQFGAAPAKTALRTAERGGTLAEALLGATRAYAAVTAAGVHAARRETGPEINAAALALAHTRAAGSAARFGGALKQAQSTAFVLASSVILPLAAALILAGGAPLAVVRGRAVGVETALHVTGLHRIALTVAECHTVSTPGATGHRRADARGTA